MKGPPTDLKARTLINAGFALISGLAIALSQASYFQLLFVVLIGTMGSIALFEYYRLTQKKGLSIPWKLGILFNFLYIFASFAKAKNIYFENPVVENLPEIILALAFFIYFVFFARNRKEPLLHISAAFLGLVYIAIPFGLIIRIAYLSESYLSPELSSSMGIFWLIYLILVTKSADLGGYFFGHLFGKHKFARHISPNKTLEGALGGLFTSIIFSIALFLIAKNLAIYSSAHSLTHEILIFALFGFFIGLASELGDLAESLLKRDAKVKDSGHLPGIGGILDLVDSLLFTSPLLYILLKTNAFAL